MALGPRGLPFLSQFLAAVPARSPSSPPSLLSECQTDNLGALNTFSKDLNRRQASFGSYIDSNYATSFGSPNTLSITASSDVIVINGGGTHNFYGNIDNSGSILVSQQAYLLQNPLAGGQTSVWVGHDAGNGNLNNRQGGLIQLNDVGSASAPTHDWYIRSMLNDGSVQWCGRGDTGGSTYQMYIDGDATNNGLISFEQAFSNLGAAFVWRNPTLTTTAVMSNLYNNGAFRMINIVYHNVQNLYGTGCWVLGQGAVLYLEDGTGVFQNPTRGPSFPNQSITFQDPSAVLHLDTAVYSRNANFGAKVHGFGTGNAIEFYELIRTFSYSVASGTLSVTMISGNSVNIKMGSGYSGAGFYQARNPQKYNTAGYNAIFYNGQTPSQALPSSCAKGFSQAVCSGVPALPSLPKPSKSAFSSKKLTSTSKLPSKPSWTLVKSNTVSKPSGSSTTVKPKTTTSTPSSTVKPSTSKASSGSGSLPPQGTYQACTKRPKGYGPVPKPDTASAFINYAPFGSLASTAPTTIPAADSSNYVQEFRNLKAAVLANPNVQITTMKSYNATECAARCDKAKSCKAFNIYMQRDPTLAPSSPECPNPSSMTTIMCNLWANKITTSQASFDQAKAADFDIRIAASNGYVKLNS